MTFGSQYAESECCPVFNGKTVKIFCRRLQLQIN
ncbi:hypothetical protein T03_12540 [Trichinella britovi]|uniref:Uncharacterized protein n=1 Tax=Trichinella britovi TaxID=45882 RepID=A0A0V1BNN0_TRIBR|nr:hypothetical protein T03_17189 [Trichinella britovi]KRY38408.1 hypothetical protein T03_12540 [Trichinella britovi]